MIKNLSFVGVMSLSLLLSMVAMAEEPTANGLLAPQEKSPVSDAGGWKSTFYVEPVFMRQSLVNKYDYSGFFPPAFNPIVKNPIVFQDLGVRLGAETKMILDSESQIEAKGYGYLRKRNTTNKWETDSAVRFIFPADQEVNESSAFINMKTLKYSKQMNSQWKLEVGRQPYQWGRFEYFSRTNVLAPLDYNFGNIYGFSYSLEREGIWSIYNDYYLNPDTRLELVLAPLAELHDSLAQYYNSLYKGLGGSGYDFRANTTTPIVSEYGARLTFTGAQSEVSLMYYYGLRDTPYQTGSVLVGSLYYPLYTFKPHNMLAVDGALTLSDSLILKAEAAQFIEDYVYNKYTGALMPTNVLEMMIGFDSQIFEGIKVSGFGWIRKYQLNEADRSYVSSLDEEFKPGLNLYKTFSLADNDLTLGYLWGAIDQYITGRQFYGRYQLGDSWALDGSYTAIDFSMVAASTSQYKGVDSDVALIKARYSF